MAIRIKDIANALNVSSATVSLALNNRPGVKKDTRDRVINYVKETGYSTNSIVKPALEGNANIWFVVYKKHGRVISDTPFFSQLIEGIERESRKKGFNLIVSYVDEKQNCAEILNRIKENLPDGMIILATEMNKSDFKKFEELNLPMISLDNCIEDVNIDTVAIDNVQGSYEATKHLVEMGHASIGYLRSSVRINNFAARQSGFEKALADNGILSDKNYFFDLEPTQDGAYQDMKLALQSEHKLPTAFFADNDIIAMGAMKALKEEGIKIPKEVSMIGFDDMPFSNMIEPALTTVSVYKQRMGMIAVRRLIDKMDGDAIEFVKILISTRLVERDSVLKRLAD